MVALMLQMKESKKIKMKCKNPKGSTHKNLMFFLFFLLKLTTADTSLAIIIIATHSVMKLNVNVYIVVYY